MHEQYEDITSRLGDPQWWDPNGVPRYVEFTPNRCGVYIDAAALLRVRCQGCRKEFLVASEVTAIDAKVLMRDPNWEMKRPSPAQGDIGNFHYGDPPFHRCIGDSMNVDDIEVLQFWDRRLAKGRDWTRVPECEGVLADMEDGASTGIAP